MKKLIPYFLLPILLLCGLYSNSQNKIAGKKLGISEKEYKSLIKSSTETCVLVEFYADWCAPCKKMNPYFEEIKNEMGEKIKLIRINADSNKTITNKLSVYSLPTIFLYKNEKMYWFNYGYASKEEILRHINQIL